ncbi:GrpB family protein [Nonomuraea sp. NPDC049400]|uniref:GrpB family protein n=1 Tax=Nonomuraea sp. NPDC049400 TaxID=3364352 RepID=UPI00378C6448
MNEPVEIVSYQTEWPTAFKELAQRMRSALGDVAVRIDHIGSTSVPGLAAKPVVDIQVSVRSFDPEEAFQAPLEALGMKYRRNNPERTKRYFREAPGKPRTHIHVRLLGSFSEQFPLLFRDYLRAHELDAAEYAAVKRRCAARFRHDRVGYVAAKSAHMWEIVRRADEWAQQIGWVPGPADA